MKAPLAAEQKSVSAGHGDAPKPEQGAKPKASHEAESKADPERKTASARPGEAPEPEQGAEPKASPGVPMADKSVSEHGATWSYAGDTGPDKWASLKSEYALCGSGKMQSPINLASALPVAESRIIFNYKATGLTLRNNGHTLQADYGEGSYILANGRRYDLLQFHFHTPSEHLVESKKYPMEMHLVHKSADGTLAVVGVMMEARGENIALSEIAAHLPENKGEPVQVTGVAINARDLLPENGRYNHYRGSLTTPPCSEGVNWFVLTKPVQVSTTQIKKFSGIMGDNARPAQAARNRLVISEK